MSRRRRRRDGDASEALDAIADLSNVDLELLVHWITDGPPRPPDSMKEVEAWARQRGLLGEAPTEAS